MKVKILLLLTLLGSSGVDCLAQKNFTDFTDSLLAQGTLKKTVQSFYVKPILEQYQSLITVEGEGFSVPTADLARKRGYGIRLGYQWSAFEIETGLSTVMPYAGYGYRQTGLYGAVATITISRSTDFYHLPLIVRYRLWQLGRKLSFRVGAGVAYNVDLAKLKLAPIDNLEQFSIDGSGNKVILSRIKSQYEQQTSFFSAELNLSTRYQFSRHVYAMLEVRRLFGPANAVRISATQEQFNPPSVRTVEAHGGTNSLGFNLGLAYQFGFRNNYRLR